MSRRITFRIVDGNINNQKAIQPKQDDLALLLLEAFIADLEQLDHDGMTVIHVSATKEVRAEQTDSSEAGHQGARNCEHHPQKTAVKEAAVGDVATLPGKSDQRLVELVRLVLNRIYILLVKCFLEELFKKCGGEVGKLFGKLIFWTLVGLFLWWMLGNPLLILLR